MTGPSDRQHRPEALYKTLVLRRNHLNCSVRDCDDEQLGRLPEADQRRRSCRGAGHQGRSPDHCLAEYRFQVGGSSYTGGGRDCTVEQDQRVTIFYYPANPSLSCLCNPPAALLNELVSVVGG